MHPTADMMILDTGTKEELKQLYKWGEIYQDLLDEEIVRPDINVDEPNSNVTSLLCSLLSDFSFWTLG